MTKKQPSSISTAALAVNQAVAPSAVDMTWIFRSLERDYSYNIHASYTGFTVGKPGETPVYQDGEYSPVQARGSEQCAIYRLRLMKFFLWAVEHAPTPEMKEYEGWLRAQLTH